MYNHGAFNELFKKKVKSYNKFDEYTIRKLLKKV